MSPQGGASCEMPCSRNQDELPLLLQGWAHRVRLSAAPAPWAASQLMAVCALCSSKVMQDMKERTEWE